jgi:hypothetical protein
MTAVLTGPCILADRRQSPVGMVPGCMQPFCGTVAERAARRAKVRIGKRIINRDLKPEGWGQFSLKQRGQFRMAFDTNPA